MGKRGLTILTVLAVLFVGACGDDDDDAEAKTTTTKKAVAVDKPTVAEPVAINTVEYAFQAPDSIKAGLVELNFTNKGKEAHLAGLAKLNEGQTFDDAKAFFMSSGPPAGPPPFVEYGGNPTADPGLGGTMTLDLPAGDYVLFCPLPAPDGTPHMVKGMLRALEVTPGKAGTLPEASAGRFTAVDFKIGGLGIVKPNLEVGTNQVSLHNSGKQLHEINLVQLADGKTIDDLVAWAAKEEGPPPASFQSGAAILPEGTVNTTLVLGRGKTYAFVCIIPDELGDGAPHIIKGMYTETFTVE